MAAAIQHKLPLVVAVGGVRRWLLRQARATLQRLLTVDEAAERLVKWTKTARRPIHRGELRVHRFGRLIRFSEDDLTSFTNVERG